MFSCESTCYPHKNKLSGKRYNDTMYNNKPQTFSHTHTHTLTLAQTNWIKSQQYFEPESSVRYSRIYLQIVFRSYDYVTWYSVLWKINEVWIFDSMWFQDFCSAQIICSLQWNTKDTNLRCPPSSIRLIARLNGHQVAVFTNLFLLSNTLLQT